MSRTFQKRPSGNWHVRVGRAFFGLFPSRKVGNPTRKASLEWGNRPVTNCTRIGFHTKYEHINLVVFLIYFSMVSCHILSQVNTICCAVRRDESRLGGLQAIFVGDFLQLPPVPNALYGDKGLHCFKHPDFNRMVPHIIKLVQVIHVDFRLDFFLLKIGF